MPLKVVSCRTAELRDIELLMALREAFLKTRQAEK
jgi:hypothetical protein